MSIHGNLVGFQFSNQPTSALNFVDIVSWGDGMFRGCTQLHAVSVSPNTQPIHARIHARRNVYGVRLQLSLDLGLGQRDFLAVDVQLCS